MSKRHGELWIGLFFTSKCVQVQAWPRSMLQRSHEPWTTSAATILSSVPPALVSRPNWTFHNFRASKSGDTRELWSSKTFFEALKLWIVFGRVSYSTSACLYARPSVGWCLHMRRRTNVMNAFCTLMSWLNYMDTPFAIKCDSGRDPRSWVRHVRSVFSLSISCSKQTPVTLEGPSNIGGRGASTDDRQTARRKVPIGAIVLLLCTTAIAK